MKNTDTYEKIFRHRGGTYHDAMHKFPKVRENEFLSAFIEVSDEYDNLVLDIPCGGGYLSSYFKYSKVIGADPVKVFSNSNINQVVSIESLTRLPYLNDYFDAVISVAGLHHLTLPERKMFYSECYRVLKPHGKLVVIEVGSKTDVASFLNGFVDRYNPSGHDGIFFKKKTELEIINYKEFSSINYYQNNVDWVFENERDMIWFFKKLFNLKLATPSQISKGINSNFKLKIVKGRYIVPWNLIKVVALK